MIVEYIRYKIDPSRNDEFENAYRRAGELLDASPHCGGGKPPAVSTSPTSRSSASSGILRTDTCRAFGEAPTSSRSSRQRSRSTRTSRR
jgi:hypothetical protein